MYVIACRPPTPTLVGGHAQAHTSIHMHIINKIKSRNIHEIRRKTTSLKSCIEALGGVREGNFKYV